MQYFVEPIGTEFSNKAIQTLSERFTERSTHGYELHTVFQVSQPGCLGIGRGTTTYLAVYVKRTA